MNASAEYPAIAISRVNGGYPEDFPFDPDAAYPEYAARNQSGGANPVYEAVRQALAQLGYDRTHYGTRDWNPLGSLISPGDRVFIKPNLVNHEYRRSAKQEGDLFSVITHPSVVRAVADYVAIALKGDGEILIGDNPCIDADFTALCEKTHLSRFERFYRDTFGIPCRVLDLRPTRCADLRYYGQQRKTQTLAGDPEGETIVNLGRESCFYGISPFRLRGVFTNRWETMRHHHGRVQEYSVSNSIVDSDVYISIPKLKTHRKVGVTLNVKGLVGISCNKNYLVHWRIGFPLSGGDEYPSPRRARDHLLLFLNHLWADLAPEELQVWCRERWGGSFLERLFRIEQSPAGEPTHRGAWEGNDTCWRMAADLYRVLLTFRERGVRRRDRVQKHFSVVDGVTAGEANGPFIPMAKQARVIIAGPDLLQVDCVAARLMDFNLERIRYLVHLLQAYGVEPGKIRVVSQDFDVADLFQGNRSYLGFEPPDGWPGLRLRGTQGEVLTRNKCTQGSASDPEVDRSRPEDSICGTAPDLTENDPSGHR